MKHTLKATAAIIGFIAVVIILGNFMKALGCLMIYISENCNIPL